MSGRTMSALGQKQTFAAQNAMSALPPNSGHVRCTRPYPLCANSGHAPQQKGFLFDHFVGPGEQRRRHSEAKRLGSLEINHQFVLGRRLHRHVLGFSPLRMRST